MLSIFGGKITTYRSLAEHVLSKLKPYFPHMEKTWTKKTFLPGGDIASADFKSFQLAVEKYPWLPRKILSRYTGNYGTLIDRILENTSSTADLGFHFGSGLYEKEVRYLMENEWAKMGEDILWRRTKLGLWLSEQEINQLEKFLC